MSNLIEEKKKRRALYHAQLKTINLNIGVSQEMSEDIDDALKSQGVKLAYFVRQAIVEKLNSLDIK